MAVRLQMKLGYAADAARLPGSPDAILSEEPTIGSVMRSKGSLYLIVTARTGGAKVGEATRMVAEAIRDAYYYDESAGIVVCLEKAIRAANKKILHQRDRLGGDKCDEANGPIGVGVAVVRGNELYVVDGRARRGVPRPAGAPLDAARPEPGPGPALERPRAERLAGRDQRRRLARDRVREPRREARPG